MSAAFTSSVAARLLRIGQSVLFVALLLIGLVRGILGGGGWPVAVGGGAVAVLFGGGLVAQRRLGPTGRAIPA